MENPSSGDQDVAAAPAPSINGDGASGNVASPLLTSDTQVDIAASSNADVAKQGTSAPPPTTHQADDLSTTTSKQAAPPATEPTATSNTDSAMTDVPIYGTRSRNRTGTARPNYAEDQDMDFEYNASNKADSKRVLPAAEPKQAQEQNSAKFIAVNNSGPAEKVTTKDIIPGTSSFSTVPSKKRKAASGAVNATSSGTATPINRVGTPSNNVSERASNTMAFIKHKALLKNGKLVADDGTTFAVNGKRFGKSPYVIDDACAL